MKRLFSTVLCAACLMLATPVLAVELTGLVTVQRGTTHGGCDNYMATLDTWYEEAIFALSSAQDAIDKNYNQDTTLGQKVRDSMFQWFKVQKKWTANVKLKDSEMPMKVRALFSQVLSWFLQDPTFGIKIDKDSTFLFCGSDFLVARQANSPAQDYQGANIVADGRDLAINDVQSYANKFQQGNVAWWSGDHSVVKGYWFVPANSGANHCNGNKAPLGMTTVLDALKQEVPGGRPAEGVVQMIILSPRAFTHDAPETFQVAEANLKEGDGIHKAVPRSATFLHEAFHVMHGTNFLEGEGNEIYGEGECIELGRKSAAKSRKNPESFVYFTTAMHYLSEDNELSKRWDFVNDPRSGRVFDPEE